jgi:hypothetical protein
MKNLIYEILINFFKYNLALKRELHESYFSAEPVFSNVFGAQESIPRKEFRQPM